MPHTIKKNHSSCPKSKPFAVVKTSDGKVMGCHSTAEKAGAQIGAIEHSEKKEMSGETLDVKQLVLEGIEETSEDKELIATSPYGEVIDTDEFVPFDAESFVEYDAAVEAKKAATEFKKEANVFKQLVDNILNKSGDGDPVEKIRSLATEFGERAKGIMRKEKTDKSIAEISPLRVIYSKERDRYLFFTAYSNNILDHDNPPEIIASKSHERFERLVDSKEVPLPAFCLWHIYPLQLGKVEVVTYDKENGIAMAAGYFHKQAEPIAKIIEENPHEWGVSHSMDSETIKKEGNVIVEHITFELGPLPLVAAANKWADFLVTKEISMSIPKHKRETLNKMGIDDEMLEDIDAGNKSLAETISALGVPTKETTELIPEEKPVEEPIEEEIAEEPTEEPVVEPAPVEPADKPTDEPAEESIDKPADEPVEEPAGEPAEEPAEEPVEESGGSAFSEAQTKELVHAFETMFDRVKDEVVKEVKEIVDPLTKSEEERITKMVSEYPSMGLQDILFPSTPTMKQQSATLGEDNIVDGRSKLGQDKPEEAKEERQKIVYSGNALVDRVMSDVITGIAPTEQ